MPSDESNLFRKVVQNITSDPWLLGNLFVRLLLMAFSLRVKGYLQFDSEYYLQNAAGICNGAWGGDAFRTPLYSMLLCGFSRLPGSGFDPAASGVLAAVTLLFQNLLLWLCGILLYRKEYRLPSLVWLYDPVLLIYSNFLMTDALFGVAILLFALTFRRALLKNQMRNWATLGVWGALAILLRTIGMPVVGFGFGLIALFVLARRIQMRFLGVTLVFLLVCLSPRLIWNYQRHHQWFLADQGPGWIMSVAGVVENPGLGFYDAETKWHSAHPGGDTRLALDSLRRNLPMWAWLSAKGTARVLFGHVNCEWVKAITGVYPDGPGWFKSSSQSPNQVRGLGMILWGLGVLGTAVYCLWVYAQYLKLMVRRFLLASAKLRPYLLWTFACALLLSVLPQVFGDARFRAPVLSLIIASLIALNGQENREKREST